MDYAWIFIGPILDDFLDIKNETKRLKINKHKSEMKINR